MFKSSKPDTPAVKTPSPKQAEAHPLDGLTGGAFSAPTSGAVSYTHLTLPTNREV